MLLVIGCCKSLNNNFIFGVMIFRIISNVTGSLLIFNHPSIFLTFTRLKTVFLFAKRQDYFSNFLLVKIYMRVDRNILDNIALSSERIYGRPFRRWNMWYYLSSLCASHCYDVIIFNWALVVLIILCSIKVW